MDFLQGEGEIPATGEITIGPAPERLPFPLGTVVSALPAGCTPTPVGGVNYCYWGGNLYKAVFEGSTLKYATTKPQQRGATESSAFLPH